MNDSRALDDALVRQRDDERSTALRALLMRPLLTDAAADFAVVRRHIDFLRDWFAREVGWNLHLDRDCARLYKRPADLIDPTRGAKDSQERGFDRRRYILFCLACAVLDRADPQITLRTLGDRLLVLAAEPELTGAGFSFILEAHHERRELVAVCRYLLELGVLVRVAGDEDGFVQQSGDALYDIRRRLADAAGLVAEQRAEGLALIDVDGELTDTTLPADGTPAHITLLVAEHLSRHLRRQRDDGAAGPQGQQSVAAIGVAETEVADFIRIAAVRFARDALARLARLRLIALRDGVVVPLPALARFALGEATVKTTDGEQQSVQAGLFA